MLTLRKTIITVVLLLIVTSGLLATRALVNHQTFTKKMWAAIPDVQEGDIIFQISESDFSTAIQLATHSKYSHCGIIFKQDDDQWYVYEALQPVRYTPLREWIARGKNGHYVVKRLKNATTVITPAVLAKMKAAGRPFNGKDYDAYFGWSDERLYCSELVWKIYKAATGLEIGALQPLKTFDLNNTAVKQQMKAIYGNHIPLNEKIISPVSMFESPLLVTVSE
ncbi:MAG: YiiX family permuted papain-like enzyme [Chitinophaga sp.]|uniref:YiiX family permuted papain-like enzyme n=1 Tax=Chitinophaga sp. TaxID=1869181 RepID=UPI001B1D3563|nr:YiiX family permuted papain-like enzyme [Chitinophaga sp.]MBO9731299.1 YiiX family permuted papain-like enzyme [Chitinophaga sp.]